MFLAFGSTQFDRDYKAGVDALRVDAPLGDFSGVTVVGTPMTQVGHRCPTIRRFFRRLRRLGNDLAGTDGGQRLPATTLPFDILYVLEPAVFVPPQNGDIGTGAGSQRSHLPC